MDSTENAQIPDMSHDMCRELALHADLFDTIERSPLTTEQRVAAVTRAKRNVLIAAAGSGKTSSMVGKVAYAIHSGQCVAEQILVLAFNRKAALELQERLGSALPVTVRTLHALGLDIVTRVNGYRPHVQDNAGQLLQRVLRQHVHHDVEFADHWLLFRVFYHLPVRHPHQFTSRGAWKAFVRKYGERRNRRAGFVTLGGELVPTQFEQAVANWLNLHAIGYVYASLPSQWLGFRHWRSRGWSDTVGFRRPLAGRAGFYLPETQSWILCLDRPHGRLRLPTSATAIHLDDFLDASVFTTLRNRFLTGSGLPGSGGMARLLALLGYRLTSGQTEFLERFVALARLNGVDPETWKGVMPNTSDPERVRLHVPMLTMLLEAYQDALDEEGSVDFEGMLHRAADYLDAGRYVHGYTLVMVDEFQDTSRGGVRLLKSILAQNSEATLFAVGDDWQSIYRFAGAIPDVLSRFEHYFGSGATNYLTATFRFDQTIADAASRFVQGNPAQLRKRVAAREPGHSAAIILGRYAGSSHMYALCEACLNDIPDKETTAGRKTSVYILGRYQHQRPRELEAWCQRFPVLDIQYLTVHSAKGLEADIVIVLGLHTGRYGFPSRVPDDPLMELVMPDKESFPDAEERRLFYVAITRCRDRVYLLAHLHEPSPFVGELLRDGQTYRDLEPVPVGGDQYGAL